LGVSLSILHQSLRYFWILDRLIQRFCLKFYSTISDHLVPFRSWDRDVVWRYLQNFSNFQWFLVISFAHNRLGSPIFCPYICLVLLDGYKVMEFSISLPSSFRLSHSAIAGSAPFSAMSFAFWSLSQRLYFNTICDQNFLWIPIHHGSFSIYPTLELQGHISTVSPSFLIIVHAICIHFSISSQFHWQWSR
jgi:hypothetical protein